MNLTQSTRFVLRPPAVALIVAGFALVALALVYVVTPAQQLPSLLPLTTGSVGEGQGRSCLRRPPPGRQHKADQGPALPGCALRGSRPIRKGLAPAGA
jgi:hypothetical protein